MPTTTGFCFKCQKTTRFIHAVQEFTDGTEHLVWLCGICAEMNPNRTAHPYLPRYTVSPMDWKKLPRFRVKAAEPKSDTNQEQLPFM